VRRLPEIAMKECVGELRAACRLPIDESALEKFLDPLRPNFERILAHPDGVKRWADHGQRMRNNGRHLGALADFFGDRAGIVGEDALMRAFQLVRQDCTVRAEATPLADMQIALDNLAAACGGGTEALPSYSSNTGAGVR